MSVKRRNWGGEARDKGTIRTASLGLLARLHAGKWRSSNPTAAGSQWNPEGGCVRPLLTATFCSPMHGRMGHCLAGLSITVCCMFKRRVIHRTENVYQYPNKRPATTTQKPQHQSTATATIQGSKESTH
jgi:hypothetical protein